MSIDLTINVSTVPCGNVPNVNSLVSGFKLFERKIAESPARDIKYRLQLTALIRIDLLIFTFTGLVPAST